MYKLIAPLCAAALLFAALPGHAEEAAKPAAATCKGPFKALLEASNANRRGVTLFLNGQTVSGIVAACKDDGSIELTAQQYSRIVVLADRIDGAAM
jgi:hypothetical protein